MDNQAINNAKKIVLEKAAEVKSEAGKFPMGLIVGGVLGYLWKGVTGAAIGAGLGFVACRMYRSSQEKKAAAAKAPDVIHF